MITGNSIRAIKNEEVILDELKVSRVGNNGNGAVFNVLSFEEGEERSIHTGHADDVAKYMNIYFDLN